MGVRKEVTFINKLLLNVVFYIALYTVIATLAYFFLKDQLEKNLASNLEQNLTENTIYFQNLLRSYGLYTDDVYAELIQNSAFFDELENKLFNFSVNNTDDMQSLMDELQSVYHIIKLRNIRVFRIYFNDNLTYLTIEDSGSEMHGFDKEKNVTEIKSSKGFVNAPEYNAYCMYYPIYKEGKYLGTIEFGIPLSCLIEEINRLYPSVVKCFIEIENLPVIKREDSLLNAFYEPSAFRNYYEYLYTTDTTKHCKNLSLNQISISEFEMIDRKISNELQQTMLVHENFVSSINLDSTAIIVSFLPVHSMNDNRSYYFAFYEKSHFATNAYRIFYNTFFVSGFFIFIITFLIYFFNRNRIKAIKQSNLIKEQANELTLKNEKLIENQQSILLKNEELASQTDELESKRELLTAVNKELEKMSIIASETNNLVYIFNDKGELEWFNDAFYDKIGYQLAEYKLLFGKSIIELSQNENIVEYYNTCIETKKEVTYDSSMKSKKGDEYWFHTTLTPIFNNQDKLEMVVAIDSDITELKSAQQELDKQHKLTVSQRDEIMFQKKELTDSIVYAKRIQEAILPKPEQIRKFLKDSFIIYLPKDIVSGDFYWYYRKDDTHFLISVDCTGHGVPGAFMSIIGTYLLNNIVIQNKVYDPAEILKHLNRKLKISLKSENQYSESSDGMDLAICKFNLSEEWLVFAGAVRPLFIINGTEFTEVKGDKNPITSNITNQTKNIFHNHTLTFEKGDVFYLFSDGITDQFGGKEDKKFLSKRLKQLLIDINMLSMNEQRRIVINTFKSWKGTSDQVDDILLIGVRNT